MSMFHRSSSDRVPSRDESLILVVSMPRSDALADLRLGGPSCALDPHVTRQASAANEALRRVPDSHQAARREQHDEQEDRADQRVEAVADETDAPRVGVDDD